MKLPKLIDQVRALIALTCLALMASLVMGQAAYAADAAPTKIDPKNITKGMAEAPAVITAGNIPCTLTNALYVGASNVKSPDGKSTSKGQTYEVACKDAPGWILTMTADKQVVQPYNCTLGATYHKTHPEITPCILPENTPDYGWLNKVVQPYSPGCVVNNARIVGSISATKQDVYEYGCKDAPGGTLSLPQLGSTAAVEYRSCLMDDGGKNPCTFTTKDQIVTSLKPLITQADAKCVISDVRFVGVSSGRDGFFYEVGCSNEPGFVIVTGNDNGFKRVVPCAAAAGIGGCKFTTAEAASADQNANYTAVLKAAGKPCTVKDTNVIGTQESTKRDYVEFKCAEQPWGLIGFVPQPGSKSDVNVTDCFLDQTRHKSCTFVTVAQLQAQVDKLIKVAEPGKNCDVKDVRWIGESADTPGAVIVEIACSNKRGYIGVISADRTKMLGADPCRLAATHGDQQKCTIPENGTYAD